MGMSAPKLVEGYKRKLIKALEHLDYSYKKVSKLPHEPKSMDEEILETWESFTARFSRVVDLFLTKYLKAYVLSQDPGFEGALRDYVDYCEKLGFIDSTDRWMQLRGFRNLISHEYEEDDLAQNFADMRNLTPQVLLIKSKL